MINTQNEIRYRIAYGMLKKLWELGLLTAEELDIAHGAIADRYRPIAVRRFR